MNTFNENLAAAVRNITQGVPMGNSNNFDNVRVYMRADNSESTIQQSFHNATTIVEYENAYHMTWGGYLCVHDQCTDTVIGEFPIGEWAGVERF